jgi:adenylate kinase family enzyme
VWRSDIKNLMVHPTLGFVRNRRGRTTLDLVNRVAVVGAGGAGKSTFARELGAAFQLPVYHLDEYHWLPGWKEPPREAWRAKQSEMAGWDQWVIEGNYGASFDIRFDRADTVYVLSLSRWVCCARVLKRVIKNWRRDVQAPGCPEHFDLKFLRWVWRYSLDSRSRLDDALARHVNTLEVIELRSRTEIREYLDGIRRQAGGHE